MERDLGRHVVRSVFRAERELEELLRPLKRFGRTGIRKLCAGHRCRNRHDLTEYIRRQIAVLVARGAVPVVGSGGTEHHWIVQRQYGSRPDEIVANVMREWLANGSRDEDPEGLSFALPEDAWTPP